MVNPQHQTLQEQSVTKPGTPRSPGNIRKPRMWSVPLSQNSAKIRKSTDHDNNLISSECGQDTSACENSGHSLHAFSGNVPKTQSCCGNVSMSALSERPMKHIALPPCSRLPNRTSFVKLIRSLTHITKIHLLCCSKGGLEFSYCFSPCWHDSG